MDPKTVYVTTSWDDGHVLDSRLADELAAHGIKGTFYVAPLCREFPAADRVSPTALRQLAEGFEIGGHTLTHPRLTELSPAEALSEIVDGKTSIEDTIGCPITSFCYPYGAYGEEHPDLVRSAGFTTARTVERFQTGVPTDLFRMGTTTHAYQHLVDVPPILRRTRSPRRAVDLWRNWDRLGRRLFDEVLAEGGVFHLWGHSWEVDVNDDWARLRSVLAELSRHDVAFVTNGELVAELEGVA
jgi:peptidoglycan/xylan/chitin deacetylase (PgdA/CDA1 family)